MKIILNKQEVKKFREFIKIASAVSGERIDNFLDNFSISRKAYLLSMVTGELTFEVKEEFVVEFMELINSLTSESAPILTAMVGLGKALIPTQMKYAEKFGEFFNKYNDSNELNEEDESQKPLWSVTSVSTEKVELLDLNKEAV